MRRWLMLLGAGTITASAIFAGTSAGSFARVTGHVGLLPRGALGSMRHLAAPRQALQVVPCSNPNHNLETYWVGHGGWGHASVTHATKFADARAGAGAYPAAVRPLDPGSDTGWDGFWPDPGAESAKYGDRLECFLVRYPGEPAMGRGRHI